MKFIPWLLGSMGLGAILVVESGCQPQERPVGAAEAETDTSRLSDNDVPRVQVIQPERTSLLRTTTQPATVHAYHQAELYAQVSGYLRELKADIGQGVEEGEVLGVIDVPEMVQARQRQEATIRRLKADEDRMRAMVGLARAELEADKARLEQAKADVKKTEALVTVRQSEYNRVERLVSDQAVTRQLLDEARQALESAQAERDSAEAAIASAQAEVAVAEAKVQAAEADLEAAVAETAVAEERLQEVDALMEFATLRAPFDGVVTNRNVDPGDLVRNAPSTSGSENATLFSIAQVDRVRVRVPLPEADAAWANPGDPVHLALRSRPGRPIEGQISRVARRLDESTRTMTAEVDLPNPDGEILPGMYGEATVTLEQVDNALVLPPAAVRFDEKGKSVVYVVEPDNTIRVVEVETGLDEGARIEIRSGLDGDERVVTALIGRLEPGEPVRIETP